MGEYSGIDLDIDSDNTNALDPPDRNDLEDLIESIPENPGKVVLLNEGDSDQDGIPNIEDGYNADGIAGTSDDESGCDHFTPMVLELKAFDPLTAEVRLDLDLDLGAGDGAGGQVRVWTLDANATDPGRSIDPVTAAGGTLVALGGVGVRF